MSDGQGAAFDETTFHMAQTWFVVPRMALGPQGAEGGIPVESIPVDNRPGADGKMFRFVPVFTDEDLARRYATFVGLGDGQLVPVRAKTLDQVESIFLELQRLGRPDVAADPGEVYVRTVPITTILEGIRRAKGKG